MHKGHITRNQAKKRLGSREQGREGGRRVWVLDPKTKEHRRGPVTGYGWICVPKRNGGHGMETTLKE